MGFASGSRLACWDRKPVARGDWIWRTRRGGNAIGMAWDEAWIKQASMRYPPYVKLEPLLVEQLQKYSCVEWIFVYYQLQWQRW